MSRSKSRCIKSATKNLTKIMLLCFYSLKTKSIILTNLNIERKNLTSMYSTPMSIRLSAMPCFENKLISPPDPTGDWSISQGDFIKILYLFCPSGKLLTTGSFSSSKNHT
ncbi:hypothetical protein V8G54_004878 [Vigna mungo]|uniref:Uncharacterized protein n=1 Tax=Vigna mungo TaxID=3915 RepID=A0AAQ3SBJ7_VIGMU